MRVDLEIGYVTVQRHRGAPRQRPSARVLPTCRSDQDEGVESALLYAAGVSCDADSGYFARCVPRRTKSQVR